MARRTKQKPPAFQFYAADFIMGTQTFSLDAVGGYMRCLCYQWDQGSVPADDREALARVLGCEPEAAALLWSHIGTKFVRRKDGNFVNLRLEIERKKQRAFSKSQSNKGKLGGRGKSRGFTGGKPGLSPGKALQSSIFRSVQDPPLTPPPGGAGPVPSDRLTREEREWATARLAAFRATELEAHPPDLRPIRQRLAEGALDRPAARTCPHTPACHTTEECLVRLVADRRATTAALLSAVSARVG